MIRRAAHPGVAIGVLSIAAQAYAQAPAETASPPAHTDSLEEIVITAERRPEFLNQVPVAASVISGKGLEERGVNTISDLANLTPSLTIANQEAVSFVNIRGVGLQAINPTTSSGVAIYSDGFFIPHETAIADEYFDVGQVEVLRGPQGTLVGQSSTGGAVFVTSVRPGFDGRTGYLLQSVGNYGYTKTEAALNVPISGELAVRFAGNFYNRDSFYRDIHVGDSPDITQLQPGNADSQSGRIGVAWQPTSALSIYIKYDTTTRKGDGYAAKNYGELAGANNNVDPRLSNPFIISYDHPSWDKYRMSRITSEINWDVTDYVALRSLSGYQHDDIKNLFDNDQTYLPASWASQELDETASEQEFDLISKQPGPFNWILGAFYLRDNTPTYLNLYTAPPGPPPPFTIRTQPTEKSYAVFGQVTYSLEDRWQLLLGARENRNDKSQAGTQTLTIPTGLPAPAPATVPVTIPLTASVRTTTPTGKAALSFFPDPDSTIYVSASRGFKAGGANAGNLVNLVFQPEKINAYEGGYKADFLDRRLRLAAAGFYYDYRNMQITALDASGQQSIVNVPKAKIYGSELEVSGHVGEIVLNVGASYNHSTVDQQLPLVDALNPLMGPQNLTGRQLPYAPRWTANVGGTYTVSTSIGKFALTPQYSYTSRAYSSLFQAVPRDLLGSHSLVDLNLSLLLNDGIRLEVYGTNLTDTLYAAGTFGTNAAVWGSPRQYGGRVGYSF
jgi:iron complex outermembrane receptor protein